MRKPLVAIVGRPNVGKSTLFNRLAGERLAVVNDTPGTTRDRITAEVEWNGVVFDIVDTGGLEAEKQPPGAPPLAIDSAQFIPEIRAQTQVAIDEADAIVFMTDVVSGITAADREVADLLRRRQRVVAGERHPPVLLAVNKADNQQRRAEVFEFYEFGLGDPIAISALQGTGTGDLLDAIVAALPEAPPETEDDSVKLAIVGRPNVGKSSLLNRILGAERAIVSPVPGTTRDAIDTRLTYDGHAITLIDTAGIRRRGRVVPGVEKYSVLRAIRALGRAEIALLVVDALEPFAAQDAHIGGEVIAQARSLVLVINKWDAVEKDAYTMDAYRAAAAQQLKFLDYAPLLFISARTGQRVDQVLPTALRVRAEREQRVPTGALNRLVRDALSDHAPPSRAGKRLKIYYAAQVAAGPPVFVFHVNDRTLVHFSYARYLENQIRARYGFLGTPLRLTFRERRDE